MLLVQSQTHEVPYHPGLIFSQEASVQQALFSAYFQEVTADQKAEKIYTHRIYGKGFPLRQIRC